MPRVEGLLGQKPTTRRPSLWAGPGIGPPPLNDNYIH